MGESMKALKYMAQTTYISSLKLLWHLKGMNFPCHMIYVGYSPFFVNEVSFL